MVWASTLAVLTVTIFTVPVPTFDKLRFRLHQHLRGRDPLRDHLADIRYLEMVRFRLWKVTVPVPIPTFEKFRLRFRPLKSYGSGSDFWKVTVPVTVPTFDKSQLRFWFRFRLLKSYSSGFGSDFEKLRCRFRLLTSYGSCYDIWQVTVPVPVPIP